MVRREGLFYGIALDRGLVPPPGATLFSAFPEHADLARSDGRDRLTIQHVLAMTMGTDWDETSVVYSNRANALARLRNRDGEAAADCDRAIRIDPRFAHAYVGRGNLFAKVGDYRQTRKAYNAALSYAPRHAGALNGRGIIFIRTNDRGPWRCHEEPPRPRSESPCA